MWNSLKIKDFNLKITALNPIEKEYPIVDKDGNLLRRVSGTFTKGHFINDATGEQHEKALRLINGKALAEIPRTKEVKAERTKEVDVSEVEDLLIEKTYLVECDSLLRELNEKGKALKFPYSNGRGYKAYKTYIFPSKIYKSYLVMVCGTTQISELITEITEIKSQAKKLNEVELSIQNLSKAQAEDLIEI